MKIPSSSSIVFATLAVSSSSTSLAAPTEASTGGLTPSTSNQNIPPRSSPIPSFRSTELHDTADSHHQRSIIEDLEQRGIPDLGLPSVRQLEECVQNFKARESSNPPAARAARRDNLPTESQFSSSSYLAPTSATGTLNPSAAPMPTPANTPASTPSLTPRAYAEDSPTSVSPTWGPGLSGGDSADASNGAAPDSHPPAPANPGGPPPAGVPGPPVPALSNGPSRRDIAAPGGAAPVGLSPPGDKIPPPASPDSAASSTPPAPAPAVNPSARAVPSATGDNSPAGAPPSPPIGAPPVPAGIPDSPNGPPDVLSPASGASHA